MNVMLQWKIIMISLWIPYFEFISDDKFIQIFLLAAIEHVGSEESELNKLMEKTIWTEWNWPNNMEIAFPLFLHIMTSYGEIQLHSV